MCRRNFLRRIRPPASAARRQPGCKSFARHVIRGADQQSAFGPRGEHDGRRMGRSGGRSVSAGVEWELVADDELAPWPRRCGRHETSESSLFADGRPSVVREDVNVGDPGRRSRLEFAQAGRRVHRRMKRARCCGSGACAGTRPSRFRVQGRADLETAEIELLAWEKALGADARCCLRNGMSERVGGNSRKDG